MKVIILSLFMAVSAHGKDRLNYDRINCNKHGIYCRILELRPKIKKSFAMQLSNLLYRYSKKYKTDPIVSVAIAMQESSLVDRDRTTLALVEVNGVFKLKRVITDVGLFQFHVATIKNMKIDLNRLKTDLEYAVQQHVKLLKRKIKICLQKGIVKAEAWGCYHSFNTKPRNLYISQVKRYLPNDRLDRRPKESAPIFKIKTSDTIYSRINWSL